MIFLDDDFLLDTPAAKTLYHRYAADLPIVDYHCHIDPKEIYENKPFENIAQLWLGGDHYKWRLMRANGVDERYITGDAPGREKFQKFAETLPLAAGNPLYHWCHLELKNYFGYLGVLSGETAQEVWDLTEARLKEDPSLTPRGLIAQSRVRMIGTTDDPCSDLCWHKKLAADHTLDTAVLPSFRPDPALEPQKPGFAAYISRLEEASGTAISSAGDLCLALHRRMDAFDALGCRAADHGLFRPVYRPDTEEKASAILQKALHGEPLSLEETETYQTFLLLDCAREYARRGWAMQLHFSCMRNPNSRMFALLGPDTGFDSMGVTDSCTGAYRLLDALDRENTLPKTILYSLNPEDNAWLDSLIGAFQAPGLPGKIQHGCPWWFNDHKQGIASHLQSLAAQGVLGNFIGMLTDSRSFLSYARHEYFRRVLCGLLGRWVTAGEYPDHPEALKALVEGICWKNAVRYFNLSEIN